MRIILTKWAVVPIAGLALLVASCGPGGDGTEEPAEPDANKPLVLATTSIWADVTANLACGGLASVESVIEPGADPHGFEPSLADRARMEEAALVVANGLGLEENLDDTLEAVAGAGTPVFRVGDHVETPDSAEDDHDDEADDHEDGHDDEANDHEGDDHEGDDHADEADDHEGDDHEADDHEGDDHEGDDHEADDHEADDHEGDDHDDEADDHEGDDHEADDHEADDHEGDDHADEADDHEGDDHEADDHEADDHEGDDHDDEADDHEGDDHGHGGVDPHIWFDPVLVTGVLDELAHRLIDDAGLDPDAVDACRDGYRAELSALHSEIETILAEVPPADRKLVTDHDALEYFADRYEFEVIGTVIPAMSTMAETNPAALEELAETIVETGVKAVFAETGRSTDTVEALADRAGRVEMAVLHTGSLGPPGSGADTYAGFMRTNARTIAAALVGRTSPALADE